MKEPVIDRLHAPQQGLEPMQASRNAPVEHFSEAVRLQGGLKSGTKEKAGHSTGLPLPSKDLNLGPPD
jgi:hypothetical protein